MAAENSFDIACKVDMQEVANAVNQAKREIETRYDLKGSKNDITQEKMDLVLSSGDEMKLKAVLDILQSKLHRRGVDLKALTIGDPESAAGGTLKQKITLQDGIPMEKAKEIVRLIKDSKIKVQASIQEKQVRVAGKNRDDLQAVIALVKGKDLGVALQFTNYRSN
ncbi:MAG TPA: YajQ family cyclic di-GMP-binding protein [Methylomirabilota bacterium]|nr:YajQ family cyclic di-GMP-binding protein [Methylomirabilota bacterium]